MGGPDQDIRRHGGSGCFEMGIDDEDLWEQMV